MKRLLALALCVVALGGAAPAMAHKEPKARCSLSIAAEVVGLVNRSDRPRWMQAVVTEGGTDYPTPAMRVKPRSKVYALMPNPALEPAEVTHCHFVPKP